MSFRKRNLGLSSARTTASSTSPPDLSSPSTPLDSEAPLTPAPGVRPSPINGRPVTSTGTATLDSLLASHSGQPLGTSLLVEETGTTDYAGTLLRYYAAEGIVQGHIVHVVGLSEQWGRDLPGYTGVYGGEEKAQVEDEKGSKERMKIAWRYERLGEFGAAKNQRASPLPHRTSSSSLSPSTSSPPSTTQYPPAFTHTFSLTHRLSLPQPPAPSPLIFHPISSTSPNPYNPILSSLTTALTSQPSPTIHRVIIPSLASPLLYPSSASGPLPPSHPSTLLPFLHALRSLLRSHPSRITVIITLPLSLYPRSSPLTRWIEILADGVIELVSFERQTEEPPPPAADGAEKVEEQPQGGLRVWKTPQWTERGGGGGQGEGGMSGGEDLQFSVKKAGFVVKGWSLPPVDWGTPPPPPPDGEGAAKGSENKGEGLEF